MIKVGAYDTELWATPAQARRAFFKGRCVLIKEPFFKRGLDGLCFIRVDQRDDIIFDIPDPRPDTAVAWHLQGNAFYTTSPRSNCSPLAAIDCWSRALTLAGNQVAVLLANRAAAELAAALPAMAAADAAVASVLDPTNRKAAFRLIAALVDMNEHKPLDGGGLAALEAVKVLPPCWWEAPNLVDQIIKRPKMALPTDDAPWEEHKEKGNTAFRTGRFTEAVDSYTQSLSALLTSNTPSLAKLLCNRAVALLQAGKTSQALMDATCAVVLQPLNVKAWHHRASALQKLGRVEASQASCDFGREAAVASGERGSLPSFARIETKLVAMGKVDVTAPKKSTAEHTAEMEAHESMFKAKSYAGANQLGFLNMMIEQLPIEKQKKVFGRRIEPMVDFRFELGKYGGGFPTGVDGDCANDYLRQSYEHARALPHTMEMHLRQEQWEPAEHDILKRLNSPWRLEWFLGGGQYGDICPEPPAEASAYAPFLRHSFSNQAYRKEVLHGGKTHVAVCLRTLTLYSNPI
jgi:tetratricopeptide (TPR) repeat protein